MHVELGPTTSMLLRELDPTVAEYATVKGTNIVIKWGAHFMGVSARLWYEKLRDTLVPIGSTVNNYHLCVFNKIASGVQVSAVFHVDDLLLTCTLDSPVLLMFEGLNIRGLARKINVGNEHYTVDMSGYIIKILEGRKFRGLKFPATSSLCQNGKDSARRGRRSSILTLRNYYFWRTVCACGVSLPSAY